MLFNEIYSCYFNTVAKVLSKACEGTLTDTDINEIVSEKAFGESMLNIPAALKEQEWKLITEDMETPLLSKPTMPLTTLQKQWMKALLNDPRIRLFNPSSEGLEDVEPLYEQEWIEYFDRYSDGDFFDDYKYQRNFKKALTALKEKRKISVSYNGGSGGVFYESCIPCRLEYSSKDDKFRLICTSRHRSLTLNISRIKEIELLEKYNDYEYEAYEPLKKELTAIIIDERNCLERFMLHFSHLEKEAKKLDDMHYSIRIKYDAKDEMEILIRILSFGAKIKVTSPDSFTELIKKRLERQKVIGK